MRATILDPGDLDALLRLLHQDVETNLFLLGILADRGLDCLGGERWLGAFDLRRPNEMTAMVYTGERPVGQSRAGTAVPFGNVAACRLLGEAVSRMGGTYMVIGPRAETDAFWEGLGRTPNRIRYDQRLYVCDRPHPGPWLEVRLARMDEVSEIADIGGRMLSEDLGIDPRLIAPGPQLARARERTEDGLVYVVSDPGGIKFKIDVGTLCPQGAQVGGTFVPPHRRCQGISTLAMRGLCRRLLREVPRVTLHVNEANAAAVRSYEAAGFRRAAAFRLVAI